MTKYIIDTCVWRDFYEDRISKVGTPLGKYASELFLKILKRKDKILFSNTLVKDLKVDYDEEEIIQVLNLLLLSDVLVKIEIIKDEYLEAKTLSTERKLPFVDCLCAIQARNHSAIMISQDKHFLEDLSDVVKTKRPQEIK